MQRITRSQEDIVILQEIDRLGVNPSKLTGYDFSSTAVVKPWGYEYLVYESPDQSICAWILHMKNNGLGTSMHCHRAKKTRLLVLEGEILLRSMNEEHRLSVNEEIIIDRAVFHSLRAMTSPCIIAEIESPSNKPDAVRWKDYWGREREEYEALCDLVPAEQLLCAYKTTPDLRDHITAVSQESVALFNSL